MGQFFFFFFFFFFVLFLASNIIFLIMAIWYFRRMAWKGVVREISTSTQGRWRNLVGSGNQSMHSTTSKKSIWGDAGRQQKTVRSLIWLKV
ncbi:hypothetical protein B0T13DRAFT_117896 [Neurospora crassa]|nr:hypothetical protein B0T13DRAFT_117896 [Neurospora crassa]